MIKKIFQFIYTTIVKFEARSYGLHLKVNHYSVVNKNVVLGNNVNFNGIRITGGGKVIIGNNFHSGRECIMISQNHNYEGTKIPYDETYVKKDIIIEDNVWLGDRVIVLGGNTIGEGAIIQAGSVVTSDIPKCAIAGGHPATVFSHRDINHYQTLKARGEYH